MQNIIDTLGEFLSNIWQKANAKPPSFEHLSEAEYAMAEGFINDFDRKVANGYFDEEVEREYRRFLFRWGEGDKAVVDSACAYMKQEAAKIDPHLKQQHRTTQDRYWQATGATDTRAASNFISHE